MSTIVLVTIHGIGFQQRPVGDTPGYADVLHERLARYLDASILSDDPRRQRTQRGQAGPIYVESAWPPGSLDAEAGLRRLGTWEQSRVRSIDTSDAPLVQGDARVAHVALVYSHLQEDAPRPGSSLETMARTTVSLGHYATVLGLVKTVVSDVAGTFQHRDPSGGQRVSLQLRSDEPGTGVHPLRKLLHAGAAQTQDTAPRGLFETIRTLEDDVATYVCRDDLRERVRAFVRDALHRICYRDDVSGVVVNAHSNGTVIAIDVMRQLTPIAARQLRHIVTSGSPLRKYVDLFTWGTDAGSIENMADPKRWTNFWDERDPVADPLAPGRDWLRGMPLPTASASDSLFRQVSDSGEVAPLPIDDRLVDNLSNSSGGGLQAHNYWDNESQVVQPLADILRQLAG